ncbi:MAG: hypothetical protein ACTHMP_04660, partial [Thermomicrobiales bacterium]
DALPLDSFGDPDNRLFPIVDQDDVDSAAHLIGKAKNPAAVKRRIVAIAKRKGLKIPDAWAGDAKHSAFTADLSHFGETCGMVLRRGKHFEAGEYADKAYSMTPEELLAAVADFQPVPLDLEHTPTVLDGKLGELRAVELGADGWSLYGTVALPQWLDEQLGGECKVSCTWDRNTKTLTKLALVNNPRVPDAAIMAAFAASQRHDTADGQFTLQMIHDLAARAGAICDVGNARTSPGDVPPIPFNSKHEAAAMQAIHDHAAQHGAVCSALDADAARMALTTAAFVAKRHSAADAKDIQQMHDLTVKQGAQCADDSEPDADDAPKKGASMSDQKPSRMDRFMKWLNGDADSIEFAEPKETPKATQPDPEQVRLKAEIAELKAERTREKAVAFAEGEIRAGRAYPAERAAIIAQYVQAATDDAAQGDTVTFADGQTGTRVEALAALFAARTPHGLTSEQVRVAAAGGQVLANQQTTDFANPDGERAPTPERMVTLAKRLPPEEQEAVLAAQKKRAELNGH